MEKELFSRVILIIVLNFLLYIPTPQADDQATSEPQGHEHLHFKDVPLLQAIDKGDLALVQKLVKEGADIDVELSNGMKPIHVAAATGQADIAEFLLDSGADVNSRSKKGITPLNLALDTQDIDTIKVLLSKEAQYSGSDIYGAIFKDHLDIVKLLVNTPELANLTGRKNITLLHVAAMAGRPAIVQYLIDQGAKVDARSGDGDTALDLATRNKQHLSGLVAQGISKEEILGQGFNYDGYETVISILKKYVSKK
jgi:ankyrin repeat protein